MIDLPPTFGSDMQPKRAQMNCSDPNLFLYHQLSKNALSWDRAQKGLQSSTQIVEVG